MAIFNSYVELPEGMGNGIFRRGRSTTNQLWLNEHHNDLTVTEHWNHGLFEGNHPLLWP